MDQSQTREFPMSMSSQSSTYTQGPRQHAQGPRQQVNTSQSQDILYRQPQSRPPGRHQDNSSEREDLQSSIQQSLMEKTVSSNFSRYQQEGYPSVHQSSSPSHHEVAESLMKRPDLGGQSHRSHEYSHRNSPLDHSKHSLPMASTSQTSAHKQTYSHMDISLVQNRHHQLQQSQKRLESETDEELSMNDYQTESQKEAELFFDHRIKKDSEIKLTKRDMEFLAEVEKEAQLYRKNGKSESRKSTTSSSSDSSDSPDSKAKMEATAVNQLLNLQSDRTHVCMTCFKTFKNKPQLTQHELVHNGVRKHVCIYCDKAFKQVCHLNQHTRVHTGERPYKCTMEGCERAFAQLSNLNHHMKNHDEHVRWDISKQYRCDICDRSYANQNSLHTHIQKLHMNLKAIEGTTSNPIVSPSPKKRKKKSKETLPLPDIASLAAAQKAAQQYSLEISDSEDEEPSPQIHKKSALSLEHELAGKVTLPHTIAKNHSGNEQSGVSQSRGSLLPEIDTDHQRFTQIKMEHGIQKALEEPIVGQGKCDLQLSQTYNTEQTPSAVSEQGKIQREFQASHTNGSHVNSSNTATNNSLPFPGHSSSSITSPPLPLNLPLPQLSLPKSIADSSPNITSPTLHSSLPLPQMSLPKSTADSSPNVTNPPLHSSLPLPQMSLPKQISDLSPSITSPPFSSNFPLPQMSLPKSIADTLPSHIRHHFPELLASSHLERESRAAMHNLFNPAFSPDHGHKSEPNRFR